MNRKNAFTETSLRGVPCHSEGKARRISGQRNNLAFTLIELLTVIAIMALLAGLLLPALTKAREKAKVAKCISTIASLQTAFSMYQVDYGMYPLSTDNKNIQHNGNSHDNTFDGTPNNLVAALTDTELGGPYIEFKGGDLIEDTGAGVPNSRKYVLKDPWGQAYIYVARRWSTTQTPADDNLVDWSSYGPYHPHNDTVADRKNNTYNIYSLGPDKETDDDNTTGGNISYPSGTNWDESNMFDAAECGHWNDSDIEDNDPRSARYDDINSWDGSRSF